MYQRQDYQGQKVYNNNQNINNNYQNQNNLARKNQVYGNNNREAKFNPPNLNQKYGDLEIETFFNNGRMQNISGRDMELKSKLEVLTNQYMTIFDNVNNMANKFSSGNDDMNKVNNIERELKDIDSYNAIEYGKFIGELYEVSKDPNTLQYDYNNYKANPQNAEIYLKKMISDNKYDVILSVNKNNSQENIKRLTNYINSKKNKNNNQNYNQNKQYESQNNNNFNYGGSSYGNQNQNNNQQPFVFGNSIYSNNSNNNNYENPNEIGNGNIYGNNYNPNQYEPRNDNQKIRVNFYCEGKDNFHEYESNEPAEALLLVPFTLKDEPKIYDQKGRYLSYEVLKDIKIKDVFVGIEPILNIY